MSRTSRKKEKPFDHISLLLMQRRDAVMQPRHLHLKRYVRHLKAVHIQLECSLLSGDRSPVAFVDWWDGFLEPCGLAPPSPSSSSTTGAFHVACIGLQSSQIKFLMRPLSVRKHVNCTLYKLFFAPPTDWRKFLETLSAKQTPSKSAIKGTKSTAQGVIDFLAALKAFPLWWATSLDTSSPTAARLHRCSMSSVAHLYHPPTTPALINSFVLPSARVFPQTNCWQKHLC